jgi:hypothetical protein
MRLVRAGRTSCETDAIAGRERARQLSAGGPKISLRAIRMSASTPVNTVGST